MDIHKLKSLVSSGENESLEFKKKVAHPEKIIREIVAFANTKGGKLLIGVDDDGTLSGLKCAIEERFALDQAIDQWVEPAPQFNYSVIPLNAKRSVILYDIPESDTKPHYVLEKDNEQFKNAYIRVEDKTMKASKEIRQILRKQNKLHGVQFNFGEKEKLLMQHLDSHRQITINEFQKIAKIPRWLASRTLVKLVLANVLIFEVSTSGDTFLLKIQ